MTDLPTELRNAAGDGTFATINDAPASLLLRAADALEALDCAPPVAEAHVGGLWVLAYRAPCGGLDVVAYSSPRLAQCPFAARWRDGRWWGVVGAFGGRETKRAVERWVSAIGGAP